jgi:hypothetical protein
VTATARVVAMLALAGACGGTAARDEPAIDAVSPATGPAQGGTTITISGANLGDAAHLPLVLVGGTQAVVQSATESAIAFTLPAGVAEKTVDVTVSDAHGFASSAGAFTYNPLPVTLAITPAGGPAAGGTTFTLTGRGFSDFDAGAVTVSIGGAQATGVQVMSDQMVVGTTAATPAGTPPFTPLDVEVSDANGSATLHAAFSTTKQGLLVISRNDQTLSYFDPTTNDSISLGQLSTRVHGCVLAPDGTLYAEGRDPKTGNPSLFHLDALSGSATLVGATSDATSGSQYALSSLAFVGSDLFGFVDGPCCSTAIKRLVSVSLASGSATLVGGSSVTTVRGEAIGTRDLATVFYAETTAGTLDTLSIASSARTSGPTMTGGQGGRVRGLITVGTSLFLLEEGNPATLYAVNPVSGALTTVSSTINGGISVCATPPSF